MSAEPKQSASASKPGVPELIRWASWGMWDGDADDIWDTTTVKMVDKLNVALRPHNLKLIVTPGWVGTSVFISVIGQPHRGRNFETLSDACTYALKLIEG